MGTETELEGKEEERKVHIIMESYVNVATPQDECSHNSKQIVLNLKRVLCAIMAFLPQTNLLKYCIKICVF